MRRKLFARTPKRARKWRTRALIPGTGRIGCVWPSLGPGWPKPAPKRPLRAGLPQSRPPRRRRKPVPAAKAGKRKAPAAAARLARADAEVAGVTLKLRRLAGPIGNEQRACQRIDVTTRAEQNRQPSIQSPDSRDSGPRR